MIQQNACKPRPVIHQMLLKTIVRPKPVLFQVYDVLVKFVPTLRIQHVVASYAYERVVNVLCMVFLYRCAFLLLPTSESQVVAHYSRNNIPFRLSCHGDGADTGGVYGRLKAIKRSSGGGDRGPTCRRRGRIVQGAQRGERMRALLINNKS